MLPHLKNPRTLPYFANHATLLSDSVKGNALVNGKSPCLCRRHGGGENVTCYFLFYLLVNILSGVAVKLIMRYVDGRKKGRTHHK